MMMSYPAVNFVQYRLTPEGAKTRVTIMHRPMRTIAEEHRSGMDDGWAHGLRRVREIAELSAKARR